MREYRLLAILAILGLAVIQPGNGLKCYVCYGEDCKNLNQDMVADCPALPIIPTENPEVTTSGTTAAPPEVTTNGTTGTPPVVTTNGTTLTPPVVTTNGTTVTPPVVTTNGTTGAPPEVTTNGTTGAPPEVTTNGTTGAPPEVTTNGTTGAPPEVTTNGTTGAPPEVTTNGTTGAPPEVTTNGTTGAPPEVTTNGTTGAPPEVTTNGTTGAPPEVSTNETTKVPPETLNVAVRTERKRRSVIGRFPLVQPLDENQAIWQCFVINRGENNEVRGCAHKNFTVCTDDVKGCSVCDSDECNSATSQVAFTFMVLSSLVALILMR
ncbi:mucin-2-like [Osmia bicornis bicornis]|uniref:mucin-2-like n=1 Tax=Osmia bicornis bicornis TaxID=1437191 RepID=UPI001EAEAC50|nr:mucin-2-like [Osmia bicornis bicornis]